MDRAPLPGRQPRRDVALVSDRNRKTGAAAHPRRPPPQSARRFHLCHFMVKGAQPMKATIPFSLLAGAVSLAIAVPATAAGNRDPRQSVGRANDAARVQSARETFLRSEQYTSELQSLIPLSY